MPATPSPRPDVRPGIGVLAGAAAALVTACSTAPAPVRVEQSSATSALAATTPPTSATTPGTAAAADPAKPNETVEPIDPANGPTACELLPAADASAAFGEPVVPGNLSTDECWWESGGAGLKRVSLVRGTEDLATWRAGHANDKWVSYAIGDEGYRGLVISSIDWRIGAVYYSLTVTYSTKGNPDDVVVALAKAVAARL